MAALVQNNKDDLVFYPAFCFKASPTHSSWVKMGAADVHRLVRVKEVQGIQSFSEALVLAPP